MNNILFFDTETTGLVKDWNNPGNKENPRLVQLGAILCNGEGRVVQTYSAIVKPIDFVIPDEVAECSHRIFQKDAEQYGIPVIEVMEHFTDLYRKSRYGSSS